MKKQGRATDAKRAAANDKPENGKTEKAKKVSKPTEPDAKFTLGSIETVKRGFVLEFVKFCNAKGMVDAAALVAEFSGRQIDGKKITSNECIATSATAGTTASSRWPSEGQILSRLGRGDSRCPGSVQGIGRITARVS
jgi:hypothetical protein